MSNPKRDFWFNAVFAVLNIGLFLFTRLDVLSLFCLGVGVLNARTAWRLRHNA